MNRITVNMRRHCCKLWMIAVLLCIVTSRMSLGQSPRLSTETLQSQARAALITAKKPNSIIFNGAFTSTEGSLQETGSVRLTVGSDGAFLINMFRSKGVISEKRQIVDGVASCSWTDNKNMVHDALNCLTPPWFYPGLALLNGSANSVPGWAPWTITSDELGDHVLYRFASTDGDGKKTAQAGDSIELVLAPDTLLPRLARFMAHPDNPGLHADIPVRIIYSDYRETSGIMIPFHIQRFVNETLTLDLMITSASVQ